jgi:hypothetical protein
MFKIITDFVKDVRRRRARGDKMRPLWQIALAIPVAMLYYPARKFVDFVDNF